MIYVVIGYRRSTQEQIRIEEVPGSDLDRAIEIKASLDHAYWDDPDVEAVILMGDSLDTIKRTHGRYFLSTSDLTERLEDTSRLRNRFGHRGHGRAITGRATGNRPTDVAAAG